MAIESLKAVVGRDKAGAVRDVKFKKGEEIVDVPRGEPKAARRFNQTLGGYHVALVYDDGRVSQFDKKGRRLRKLDPYLSYYADKLKGSKRR